MPSREEAAWWFEAGLSTTSSPLFVLDKNQCCLYLNPAAERFSGLGRSEIVGRPLHELLLQTTQSVEPIPPGQIGFYRALLRSEPVSGEATFSARPSGTRQVEEALRNR